ncbi:alpha beta hydrolase [Chlorella sorokiniana]|uniref:Alpha beta hydrolase n=1 Tax=Chlorella sorokiniana TaxID=3076 RepID=A0A2P6TXI5_CHLSO|nr:alpha beta hydrolase [Chlorella sorokiniana]|eukprot:PRW58774.1 alpha beta hydrolase [Chlorella sorokiniana]
MVAPSQPAGQVQGGVPTTMEELEAQAIAFQHLLGLDSLPQSGREAREAARRLGELVLASAAPAPLLTQLVAEHLDSLPPARVRFVDASTGLRLRYLEWGSGSKDVVLLLHDCGEAAEVWRPIGPRLDDRGYRVIAPDLRGHGESGRSLDCRYGAASLAEDVKALIVALDLYVAPVALVGCGMGAATALVLAQQNPFLAGAVLASALLAGLPALRCHLLLLHGGRGSWVEPADAAAMAEVAAQGSAASAAVAELPGAGHYLAADQPDALLRQVVKFLEGPAIRCFSRAALMGSANGAANGSSKGSSGSADVRRPEVLDLKPLPQYASLEEAQKALGPRAIPTAAAIESELRKLRVEEGRAADDGSSDDEEGARHRTALANNPSDYFGMVG